MTRVQPPAPAVTLTAHEQRWLDAFLRMDDQCRHDNLIAMEGQARIFPRHTRPVLHIVKGDYREHK